jgi:ADP-heptose:LPS heptosyltransferase
LLVVQPILDSFYNKTKAARKVIVVDLGFLGDSVHLLPALREIKRQYPEAALHALSSPVGAEILRMAPFVEKAWDFPLGPPSPPWWKHWDIIRNLRQERFDVAFNFSGADRTLVMTALTGAKWRIGYPGERRHFWSKLLIPDWMTKQARGIPVYEQRRQGLASCGLSLGPVEFGLAIPEASRAWVAENVPADAIHLSINASSPMKEWPLANWVGFTKQCLAAFPKLAIVATGSSRDREQERLRELKRQTGDSRVRILPPGLTVPQLAALLGQSRLHVGADSGVLHLAMALGRPTIALFRDYPAAVEWLPQGTQHRHLKVACECADRKFQPCAEKGEAACLGQLAPEQVIKIMWELM